jgi:hypothetical protein
VAEAQLDLRIEKELRERDNAVRAQLKRQNHEQATEIYDLREKVAAQELEIAELRCRLRQTEDAKEDALRDRADLAEQLQTAIYEIETLKAEKSIPVRHWPEHFFCKQCNKPCLEWNGHEYRCMKCG